MSFARLAAAAGLSSALVLTVAGVAGSSPTTEPRLEPWAASFAQTDRNTGWELVERLQLDFPTHHPQGFAIVGDRILMSSVEIVEPTVKYDVPVDGHDRSPGKGVGHLFVLDRDGELLEDIELGAGDMYHPGGIDTDGEHAWVPVAEYRPDSSSVVYRVDLDSLEVEEAFRYDDHVGGVVRDTRTGRVHGVSWGSRRLFSWTPRGRLLTRGANPDHMLDYQDCAYAGDSTQLCSGITGLPGADGGSYELGGLALTSLRDGRVLHEVPFPRFSAAGHVATRNPVALEQAGSTLRLIAAPDDGDEVAGTELLVYEAPVDASAR